MKASGLTVGGFYKHFRSKDELLAEAIAQAFSDSEKFYSSIEIMPREDRWKELVRLYLSLDHCDHPDIGCPVAALAPEIARAKLSVRKRISGVIKAYKWVEFMPGASAAERERRSESETSLSFLARWRVRYPLPASLRSLPTRRESWLAYEIIFCTAFDFS
jgi:TetR/AcrR family transcriptional repressor of nem operon